MASEPGYPKDDFKAIKLHLELSNIFDHPKGTHLSLIEKYYNENGGLSSDTLAVKLSFIREDLHRFNRYLDTLAQFKTDRLNAEKQARLEPRRTETAINKLSELGFVVKVIDTTELQFEYAGSTIRYYPYSGWATGKTIKDGRGARKPAEAVGS